MICPSCDQPLSTVSFKPFPCPGCRSTLRFDGSTLVDLTDLQWQNRAKAFTNRVTLSVQRGTVQIPDGHALCVACDKAFPLIDLRQGTLITSDPRHRVVGPLHKLRDAMIPESLSGWFCPSCFARHIDTTPRSSDQASPSKRLRLERFSRRNDGDLPTTNVRYLMRRRIGEVL